MKKIAVLAAIVAVAALAAPAMSATNPFMDVPMNHWAYDAIGQLAAHGILSGFPDGLYKGGQQTTRYEMASALARSLAVVDMTKASKQDVEMLKKLVVEFKDELEALGVRVDELDERVALIESRLGGWHIHGSLVVDVTYKNAEDAYNGRASLEGDRVASDGSSAKGTVKFDNARLFFERTFGENDEYFFRARLRNDGGDGLTNANGNSAYFDRYYVTMPFFFDSRLTVGRFLFDVDSAYRPSVSETGSWTGGDSVLTDTSELGFAFEKNFGVGEILAYVSHTNRLPNPSYGVVNRTTGAYGLFEPFSGINRKTWAFFLMGKFQFTENIGLDLGAQAFLGDNSSTTPSVDRPDAGEMLNAPDDVNFKNLWTVFAGLRFNFNDAIALKGAFYHQKAKSEVVVADNTARYGAKWSDMGSGILSNGGGWADSANHWRVIVDVKQEALKFTSLWLEYGQYGEGFWVPQGMSTIFPSESRILQAFVAWDSQALCDIKYWRVVLGQEWNEKWATNLFYYGYNVDAGNTSYKPTEFGGGVQYKFNDVTTMGLNYVHVQNDLPDSKYYKTKDDIVRFRTSINF